MDSQLEETIVAISTPIGKSGIGVIRLSGRTSRDLVGRVFRSGGEALRDRSPLVGKIYDPKTDQVLDQVVATYFQSPRSYTREDVIEISCHGSPVLLKAILGLFLELGARLARPGEFTLRAFLNGAMDLTQAEAVHDLIEAQTLFQARVAQQQAMGALSRRLKPVKDQLVRLISILEAGIDFADDDVSVLSWQETDENLTKLREDLEQLHRSFGFGKIIESGLSIAIIGRPNVGKSSIFNALLDEDRAIVTEIPGTTRDLISETTQILGIPVRFLDTAGIREVEDSIEQIGINKSWQAAGDADRVLLVVDGSQPLGDQDINLMAELQGNSFFLVINKVDLPQKLNCDSIPHQLREVSRVSAKTQEGIQALREALFLDFTGDHGSFETEQGIITNIRQERLVAEALEALARSVSSAGNELPHEILLLDLYAALRALNALTGETTVEDILDNIFSRFCIGK